MEEVPVVDPRERIILYDRSIHRSFRGELILSKIPAQEQIGLVPKSSPKKDKKSTLNILMEREELKRQGTTTVAVVRPSPRAARHKFGNLAFVTTQSLATLFLFVSIFTLTFASMPLILAEIFLRVEASSSKESTVVADKSWSLPTPYPYLPLSAEDRAAGNGVIKDDFKIVIPKINLESDVIKNVDMLDKNNYQLDLSKGVAHARGSYLPDQNGMVVLFAHSTDTEFNIARYNAKFFAVKNLHNGDEVDLNYKGKQYRYQIVDRQIISPNDLSFIQSSTAKLALSTCYPPGTAWQRLIVLADPVLDSTGVTP